MVKLKHRGLLVIGLNNHEYKMLKCRQPLLISLDDVGLEGQGVVIIHADSNEALANQAKDIAERLVKVDTETRTGLVLPDKLN